MASRTQSLLATTACTWAIACGPQGAPEESVPELQVPAPCADALLPASDSEPEPSDLAVWVDLAEQTEPPESPGLPVWIDLSMLRHTEAPSDALGQIDPTKFCIELRSAIHPTRIVHRCDIVGPSSFFYQSVAELDQDWGALGAATWVDIGTVDASEIGTSSDWLQARVILPWKHGIEVSEWKMIRWSKSQGADDSGPYHPPVDLENTQTLRWLTPTTNSSTMVNPLL